MFTVVVLDHSFSNLDIEREILEPLGARVLEYQCFDPEEAAVLAADADAVLVTNGATLTGDTIARLKRCRLIVKHGIGVDIVDVAAASRQGIMVANIPDYCLEEVAEHALALTLACARRIFEADRSIRRTLTHDVVSLRPIRPIGESVFGIVGMGRIGRLTAGKLAALGGEVVFHDPFVTDDLTCGAHRFRALTLAELCASSDFIIVHAPYTGKNYHMLGAEAFARMRRNPWIVNVGRGELIDNDALLAAIREGRVSGAALDVVEGMPPLRADDPLLICNRILLTPHSAWYSERSLAMLQREAANEVRRVMQGGTPRSWYNRNQMREGEA
ncbi:MAG: C-terminal binding protein [Clostridiales bacterium]|nr:C-terminal binding protein [Clostridiales bacterium]